MNTCSLSVRCTLALTFLASPLHGETIGYEPFNYADETIDGLTGGSHWDYKNTAPAGHTGTASNWDVLSGAPNLAAGRLETSDGASVKREYNGANEAEGAVNGANVANKVYYKVTYTHGSDVSFAGMSSFDFGSEQVFFGVPFGETNFGVQIVGFSPAISSTAATPGQTYTLVAKLDHAGDVIALFVNPDLSQPEPATPAVSAPYTDTNWSTAVRLASGGSGTVTWDDVLVATTWANLTRVVTNTSDANPGSLRSVLASAKNVDGADIVTFQPNLSGQIIPLASEILIDSDYDGVTIDASMLSGGVTITDGPNESYRLFRVDQAAVTMRCLTLANGGGNSFAGGGGAIYAFGNVIAERCTFVGNRAAIGGAIENQGTLTLRQCTFSGNSASGNGGAIWNWVTLALTHCTLSGNDASSGGAIFNNNNANATIANSIVAGNSAPIGADIRNDDSVNVTRVGANVIRTVSNGAGVNDSGPVAITADPLLVSLGNFGGPTQTMPILPRSPARNAAVGFIVSGDQRGFPIISQPDIGAFELFILTVNSNAHENENPPGPDLDLGEAISIAPVGAAITFDPNVFTGGGANVITLNPALGQLVLNKSLIIDGAAIVSTGEGVTVNGANATRVFSIGAAATVIMHHVSVINGKAPDGAIDGDGENGGGILNSGTLELNNCTLSDNRAGNGDEGRAGGSGGGIFNTGTVTLERSTISENSSGLGDISPVRTGRNSLVPDGPPPSSVHGVGGGVANLGSLIVRASTIADNQSFFRGGGIFSSNQLMLDTSTIAGNEAYHGGGLYSSNSQVTLFHSTLSQNMATTGGGIYYLNGSLFLQNSIIAANTASSGGPNIYRAGSSPITTAGANLIDDPEGAGPIPGTVVPGDPRLAPLGPYGGSTLTMALRPGSPARDQVPVLSFTDQRGFPRLIGPHADLGAYEAGTFFPDSPAFAAFNAYIWETLPFNTTAEKYDVNYDYDGDGQANYAEWLAGTDLQNRNSVFRIVSATRVGANLRIAFSTVTGRSYTLWFTDNLTGTWTNTGLLPIVGNGGNRFFDVPHPPIPGVPKRFYEVRVAN